MTGLNLSQLKWRVIDPALTALGLGGDAAVNLLTGTALVESGASALVQANGGPARGLWQMEPATHDDIWNTFFPANEPFETRVRRMCATDLPRLDQLITNLRYACAMARLKYYRSPDPLPSAKDATGLCQYWKQVYNSLHGRGVVDSAHITLFQRAIVA